MSTLDERAIELLRETVAIIDQTQYFDAEPMPPRIDRRLGIIRLLIHLGVHKADQLLTRGPNWAQSPRHPYIKVEETYVNNERVMYLYHLVDFSFDYEEGYHRHPEKKLGGRVVTHHQWRRGREEGWEESPETGLGAALNGLIESIWNLRG